MPGVGSNTGRDMTDNLLEENTFTVQQMKTIPALENFNEQDLERLLQASTIQDFKDGDLITEENAHDNRIFYLIAGKAKIMKSGRELMVLRRTGDVFGEMGVITGVARSASVFAVGNATCLAVKLSDVDHLDETSRLTFKYLIYRSFAEIMANRLKRTTDELMEAREKIERLQK